MSSAGQQKASLMPDTPSPPLPRLFQPFHHNTLRLRNRVVMAPMTRRFAAEDGVPTVTSGDGLGR